MRKPSSKRSARQQTGRAKPEFAISTLSLRTTILLELFLVVVRGGLFDLHAELLDGQTRDANWRRMLLARTAGRRNDAVHAQILDHLTVVVVGVRTSMGDHRETSIEPWNRRILD